MPDPSTPVLSTFTTTENPLATGFTCPWFSGDGNLQAASGVATDTGGSFANGYYDLATFGPDCEVYATLTAYSGTVGRGFYLGVKLTDVGLAGVDGYYLYQNGTFAAAVTDTQLRRIDNGVETVLGATFSMTLTAGDKVMLQVAGNQVSAWSNNGGTWTQIAARTDSTYQATTGALGLGIVSTGTTLDDFGGGTIGGIGSTRTVIRASSSLRW